MLASKINKQIRALYWELFNHLSYKYLVEKEARVIQSKYNKFILIDNGQHVETKIFISEELMYKSYALYLYYLNLLKRENFNPETDLRVKIFCDCTKESSINCKKKSFCCWIYGLKKDQIISLVKNLNTKEERIREHIEKVCTVLQDKKKCKIEYEYYQNLRNEFKYIKDYDLQKRILKTALGYDIELNINEKGAK